MEDLSQGMMDRPTSSVPCSRRTSASLSAERPLPPAHASEAAATAANVPPQLAIEELEVMELPIAEEFKSISPKSLKKSSPQPSSHEHQEGKVPVAFSGRTFFLNLVQRYRMPCFQGSSRSFSSILS